MLRGEAILQWWWVIWHCGRGGAAARSETDSDTEPVLGKVTIGLMGKGAVMSSHGGKTPLFYSLPFPSKRMGEGDQTRITVHTDTHMAQAHPCDSSNPPLNWPEGKETLVLINPSNKECKGAWPQKTCCRSVALLNKTHMRSSSGWDTYYCISLPHNDVVWFKSEW